MFLLILLKDMIQHFDTKKMYELEDIISYSAFDIFQMDCRGVCFNCKELNLEMRELTGVF